MVHATEPMKAPASAARSSADLSKLIYQSQASEQFGSDGLVGLLDVAVTRNEREKLTGTLVYDQGRFIQWLEGPPESLKKVVNSIRVDPRHTAFEVLRERPIEKRTFKDWQMRLAVRKSSPMNVPVSTLRSDDAPLDALMSYPDAAPSLLRVVFGQDAVPALPTSDEERPLKDTISNFVGGLGFSPLFDEDNLAPDTDGLTVHLKSCATELARLFSSAQDEVEPRRIEAICRTAALGLDDFARLFCETAGVLGDLWHDNMCTEADIAVAMSELQLVYSHMRRRGMMEPDRDISDFRVLVAHMPGDLHIVGTILKADLLRSRGWNAVARFPATRAELVRELRESDVDCLVIATSRVSASQDQLERLDDLIDASRVSSRNSDIVIVVGGRVFSENPGAWYSVGADAASDSPLALSKALRGLLGV